MFPTIATPFLTTSSTASSTAALSQPGKSSIFLCLQIAFLFLLCVTVLQSGLTFAGVEYRQEADELLPVDCLLPGAVRKLGGRLTYLTARRPVKTTGVDCEIRGGEYVLYDRADYNTALAIWLPMAEQGDPRAQNYVGEIYERGLGTEPDYALAAKWYNKAAEQKYAAAQVNLGQLYETGRGVSPSMDLAIDWYRKASGIGGKQLRFVSWDYSDQAYAAMKGEIADQSATLAAQQRKIEALTAKLDVSISKEQTLTADIANARKSYRQESKELDAVREALEERQKQLSALQSSTVAAVSSTQAQQALESERKALAASNVKLAGERAALEQQRALLGVEEKALARKAERLATQIAQRTQEPKKPQVSQESKALEKEQQALAMQRADLDGEVARLEKLERELEQQKQQAAGREQAADQEIASAQNMKAEVAQQKAELAQLQADAAKRENALAERESALHEKNTELKALTAQLEATRTQLQANASSFAGVTTPEASAALKSKIPVIEMIEPRLLATRGDQYVVKTRAGLEQRTIIGRVLSQNPIIDLLVNEQNVEIDERGIFQRRIPISGKETKVSIVAVDRMGLRSDLAFVLGVEDAPKTDLVAESGLSTKQKKARRKVPKLNFGNYHALLIGNQDYATLPDLDTTIYDATEIRDVLRDRYGFKTTLLTNASRYDMLSALEKLRQELTEDDNLLIYYAGHGELDEVNTRGHWLPVDAEINSRANWISNVAISDILNSMSANKVLVVADSCYSGSMTRSTLARLDAGRSDKAWVSWLKKQANSHSRLLFSSGGVAPVLDGGGGKHSIFAKALLDVLSTNESVLEGREVHTQVAQVVNYAALAAQFDQTPMYAPIKFAGHEGGDFLFVPAKL